MHAAGNWTLLSRSPKLKAQRHRAEYDRSATLPLLAGPSKSPARFGRHEPRQGSCGLAKYSALLGSSSMPAWNRCCAAFSRLGTKRPRSPAVPSGGLSAKRKPAGVNRRDASVVQCWLLQIKIQWTLSTFSSGPASKDPEGSLDRASPPFGPGSIHMPDGHQHSHDEGRGHVRHTQTPLVRRENRGPDTCPGPRQRELPTLPHLLRSEPRLRSRQKRKLTSSWLPPLDRRENSQDRHAFRDYLEIGKAQAACEPGTAARGEIKVPQTLEWVRPHPISRMGNDGISDYSASDRLASSEDSPRPESCVHL